MRREEVKIGISSLGRCDLSIAEFKNELEKNTEFWFKCNIIAPKELISLGSSNFTVESKFELLSTVISFVQQPDFSFL